MCLKELELNDKPSAKERKEKKRKEKKRKGLRAEMKCQKGKKMILLRANMCIIFHPKIILFITPKFQCAVLLQFLKCILSVLLTSFGMIINQLLFIENV